MFCYKANGRSTEGRERDRERGRYFFIHLKKKASFFSGFVNFWCG